MRSRSCKISAQETNMLFSKEEHKSKKNYRMYSQKLMQLKTQLDHWSQQILTKLKLSECHQMQSMMSSKEFWNWWVKMIHLGMQWRDSWVNRELFHRFWISMQTKWLHRLEIRLINWLSRNLWALNSKIYRMYHVQLLLLQLGLKQMWNIQKFF